MCILRVYEHSCIQKNFHTFSLSLFWLWKNLRINLIFKFKGFVFNEYACDSNAKFIRMECYYIFILCIKYTKAFFFVEYYYSYWRFYRCFATLEIFMVRYFFPFWCAIGASISVIWTSHAYFQCWKNFFWNMKLIKSFYFFINLKKLDIYA